MSEERRIDVRTLIIASLASAAAALITSQIWIRGTPIAAAVTPVLVTILSEMLHRPTEKIADRFTAETDALPEAAGADPPPPSEETSPSPAYSDSVSVYRQPPRKRLPWGPIAATAAAAFAIGAAIVTVPELVTGHSIGDSSRHTTLTGGKKSQAKKDDTQNTTPAAQPQEQEQQSREVPTTTQPAETAPTTTPTTPTTTQPQSTTPAPKAPTPPAQ